MAGPVLGQRARVLLETISDRLGVGGRVDPAELSLKLVFNDAGARRAVWRRRAGL
jgi:hypothetical protein